MNATPHPSENPFAQPGGALSDAVFRQTASDPKWIGHWLEKFTLDQQEIASQLGINTDQLVLLALCRTPRQTHFEEDLQIVCQRTGANAEWLRNILQVEQQGTIPAVEVAQVLPAHRMHRLIASFSAAAALLLIASLLLVFRTPTATPKPTSVVASHIPSPSRELSMVDEFAWLDVELSSRSRSAEQRRQNSRDMRYRNNRRQNQADQSNRDESNQEQDNRRILRYSENRARGDVNTRSRRNRDQQQNQRREDNIVIDGTAEVPFPEVTMAFRQPIRLAGGWMLTSGVLRGSDAVELIYENEKEEERSVYIFRSYGTHVNQRAMTTAQLGGENFAIAGNETIVIAVHRDLAVELSGAELRQLWFETESDSR